MAMENLFSSFRKITQRRQENKLVFIACLLSGFCGILGIGVGLFMIFDTSATTIAIIGELGANTRYIRPAAFLMLFSGIMAFAGGLLGCIACVFDRKFLLMLYLAGVGNVCILVLAAFAMALLYKFNVAGKAEGNARKKFNDNIINNDLEAIERIWKPLQMELRCCGMNGAEDYLVLLNKTEASSSPPIECCVYARVGDLEPLDRDKCFRWEERYYRRRGCATLITNSLTKNTNLISFSAAATIWIQLPAGYLGMMLFWLKRTTVPGGDDPGLSQAK